MSFSPLQEFESSNVKGARYDSKGQVLEVQFKNGGTYQYTGVPANLWRNMRRAKSKGKWLNRAIKSPGFEYTKIAGAPFTRASTAAKFSSARGVPLKYLGDRLFEKLSGSKIREAVRVVRGRGSFPWEEVEEYALMLGDSKIGDMVVGTGGHVVMSKIAPEFRGMGLGSKFYGEVMRMRPEGKLMSDSLMSDQAVGLWESMLRKGGPDRFQRLVPLDKRTSVLGNSVEGTFDPVTYNAPRRHNAQDALHQIAPSWFKAPSRMYEGRVPAEALRAEASTARHAPADPTYSAVDKVKDLGATVGGPALLGGLLLLPNRPRNQADNESVAESR